VADVNANIGVNIDASNALAQLKSLQRQLSQFHTSVAKSSSAAATAQASLQKNLINSINATGAFTAELRTVRTTSEAFTNSLEKNKFSMREYFRYAGAATKTFGKTFQSEFDTIGKVAEDRVKKLQTQYIKLGRDTTGAMKAIAIIPEQLDLSNHSTQVQLASQRQAIFNQLLKQGSTNLLNFGKNTQWAGRQLMVGFTLPLASLGMVASKSFMDMETAALKFRKVYGDLLTPKEETQQALENIQELAKEFTKYGISVSQTVSLAAEAAAAGFQGLDLQRQTTEATRLSILGQIDTQQALDTTIALQNAFKMSSEDLADSINFLNAVENQTVVSLDDITIAIPKVAPVIQQLGGDVKDLAFFMTAMKQGGINASEGANALKSGLASLINPTNTASKMLAGMGINIKNIVESNQGDLKSTVIDFALALDKLDPLNRARAIEQMFGKFQFARLSALFSNVIADGTQASRVLDLAGASIEDLATLSESELGMTAESSMNKFKKAVEDLKFALVPVGEAFLQAVTPIVEFFSNILEKFAGLSDNTKKIITILTIAIGGIGPVALMAFGLLANGLANIIKLFATLRNGYLRLTGQSTVLGEQTQYMTNEQLEAAAAAHSLNQSHANLTQTFTAESSAVRALIAAYTDATSAASRFAMANPGMMLPGRGRAPRKLAVGGIIKGPGTETSDSIPAMLSNGEAVIPAENVKKYPSLVAGLIAGNIPGFAKGTPRIKKRQSSQQIPIYQDFAVRMQDALQNQSQESGMESFENILSPLVARIGEARGITPSKASVTSGQYEPIIGQYTDMVKRFTETLNTQFEATAGQISNESERFAKAWQHAGKSVESEVNLITSEAEKGAVRKAFGLDPDQYGTVATDLSFGHGFRGRKARFSGGAKSYTDPGFKAAARGIFEKVSGRSSSGMDVGHVFDVKTREKMGMPTFTTMQKLKKDPATSQASLNALKKSTGKYHKEYNTYLADLNKKAAEQNAAAAVAATAKEAGTASPSKKTIKIGEDVGKGLEVGMKSRKDDIAKVGKDLGNTATNSISRGTKRKRRVSQRGQGPAPIGPNAPAGATMLPIVSQPTQSDLRRTQARDRFRSVKGRVAGSLGGARGLGVSSGLMMGAQFLPGKAGNIASQVSGIAFVGQALMMLPGPLKLFAAGLVASVAVYKIFSSAIEKARLKIEGLGDVATMSKEKLSTLGSFFGVTARELSRETRKPGTVAAPIGATQRSAVDQLKATEDFQKNFKNDINALSSATVEDATMIFNALAIQLKGRGFASEQIKTIIQALQEEAGKTSINLDFEGIGVATAQSVAQQATIIGLKIQRVVDEAVTKTVQTAGGGRANRPFSDEQLAAIDAASSAMSAVLDGVIGQFEGGEISADSFKSSIDAMSQSILKMPEATQAQLIAGMLEKLGRDASVAVSGIKDYNTQLKATIALSMGIISTDNPIFKVLKKATDPRILREFNRDLDNATSSYLKKSQENTDADALGDDIKGATTATEGLSKASEAYLNILDKEITALEKKRDANKSANNEMQRQIDLQLKMQDLSNQMKIAQISGNYLGASLLGQQQRKTTLEFNQETKAIEEQKVIDRMKEREAAIKGGAKLTPAEKAKLNKNKVSAKVPKFHNWNGPVPGTYGQELPAMLRSGTEGVYQEGYINDLKQAASSTMNSASSVYNVTMTINGGNSSPAEIADQVMKKMQVIANKNNKTNAGLR